MVPPELESLIGHELPAGRFRLPRYQNWLAHDAFYSNPDDIPHPMVAFIGVRRGISLTTAEFFALLGVDMDAGPMLLECTLEFPGDLQADVDYHVSGSILDIERKRGRKLGVFDLVTSRFWLRPSVDGDAVAIVTNKNAVPRKASQR